MAGRRLELEHLRICLEIAEAERKLLVRTLQVLEHHHVERNRKAGRDEQRSFTLQTIRRVLGEIRELESLGMPDSSGFRPGGANPGTGGPPNGTAGAVERG